MIDRFDGSYNFLSNFYNCSVNYLGRVFNNSESAFQAAKCALEQEVEQFTTLDPGKAKRLGRLVKLRPDWEQVKDGVMYEIVKNKFTIHKNLQDLLLATKDEELVEGNYWHDTYWGVCNGVGKNTLGKILMRVREELRSSNNKGWICPKCNKVNAPDIKQCDCNNTYLHVPVESLFSVRDNSPCDRCPTNTKNGGSGICGCTLAEYSKIT